METLGEDLTGFLTFSPSSQMSGQRHLQPPSWHHQPTVRPRKRHELRGLQHHHEVSRSLSSLICKTCWVNEGWFFYVYFISDSCSLTSLKRDRPSLWWRNYVSASELLSKFISFLSVHPQTDSYPLLPQLNICCLLMHLFFSISLWSLIIGCWICWTVNRQWQTEQVTALNLFPVEHSF